ncbi:MAG: dephospho-CoA kinase [Anaerolineae bacterium]|nr:dephospho-CoA kinase [Anaerolineae bacterium]
MGRWSGKYVIGLTGNIAMGKSLVRRMLEHLGAYTIDADGLTHQVMAPGAPAYKPTIMTFGQWILDSEKRIDRAKLGAVAFAHPEALARLEALTHPIIGRAIDTLIQRARHEIVVVEAIKLLEGAMAKQVDTVWVVDASEEKQLERLVGKRGLSRLEGLKRIRVQNPQVDKLSSANVVITNNGTPEETWAQVQAAWTQIEGAEAAAEAQDARIEVAKPAASARPAVTPAPGKTFDFDQLEIVRGKPGNAEQIAQMVQQRLGKTVTRADVLMKSYMLAMAGNTPVGLVGFVVENLVTRCDEFVIIDNAPITPVAGALIKAIEHASRELQSEVGFIFLPPNEPAEIGTVLERAGYEKREVEEIKVPAWREAAREARPDGYTIFAKKLRAERVLKPL